MSNLEEEKPAIKEENKYEEEDAIDINKSEINLSDVNQSIKEEIIKTVVVLY